MGPVGLSSRADQSFDAARSWAITHDQVIVWVTPNTIEVTRR